MYSLKIFFSFIKNYPITILVYILFQILSFPLESIAIPQIYSHFFDALANKSTPDIFIKYLLLIFIFLFIVNFSNCTTTYIESYLIPELNGYIINYIFKNLLKKYENSIDNIELGKIITRLSVVPQHLKELIVEFCIWIFPRILTIIIINIYFFIINWKLGLFSVFILIIFTYICIKYFFSCKDLSMERYNLFEKKTQDTQDKLSNNFSIYANGYTDKEIKTYELNTNIYRLKFQENLICLNKAIYLTSAFMIIIFLALNSFTSYLYINKEISFTNLIAIFITIIYYIPCIITINSTMPNIINYYGSLKAVDSFIEDLYNVNNTKIENEIYKPSIEISNGSIIINNLNFEYKDNNKLFDKFYLTIKNNEKVAIIGPSGNGKSTLIKLIMGYYKISNNMIYINNIDINNYEINDLRKQIGYVNQNTKLFNTSILENIQYGNDTSKEDILEFCKKLNILNIFENLKNGLDTNAGIEGNNLSGGQKQIIHILRCIFKKNKIVILDEPTSAIDKENKQNIIKLINELSKNCTLIIITHDDSLLSCVNRIVTLNNGKIVEDKYK